MDAPTKKSTTLPKDKFSWDKVEIPKEVATLISSEAVKKYRFIPFGIDGDYINVAIVDKDDLDTQNALRFFSRKNGKKIKLFDISEDDFSILEDKYKNPEVEISEALSSYEANAEEEKKADLEKKEQQRQSLEVLKDAPVAKMIEVIIKNAIDGGASDIHIEPLDKKVRVRYRVDGVLYNSINLPKKIGPALVSRVKILSNLKIDEKRKPQDGRFRMEDLGKSVDFRVSSFPTSYGEKVVMRILDTNAGLANLDSLGVVGRDRKELEENIKNPYGIILVTGPTGSGKSTTLYALLRILNKVGVNIVTLEDPVEYVIDGVNQSQVKPEIEYTFASGLRSLLRQDPDIIMVGEIRDAETAELAVHAALTGHLVLSTLHTNSAIGAIARLIDMGIQPFLLTSALELLVAQRLVRRICQNCKEEVVSKYVPSEAIKMIREELKKMPKQSLKLIKEQSGLDDLDNFVPKIYKGKGCGRCQKTGMHGRVGIFETVKVTGRIGQMISDNVGQEKIEQEAIKNGYTTMKQDGIIKVLNGETP